MYDGIFRCTEESSVTFGDRAFLAHKRGKVIQLVEHVTGCAEKVDLVGGDERTQ